MPSSSSQMGSSSSRPKVGRGDGRLGRRRGFARLHPATLGATTSGSFSLYFDGSDVGLSTSSGEDIDAAAVDAAGRIYLSTLGSFAVNGASGEDEDVFVFTPATLGTTTAGTFDPLLRRLGLRSRRERRLRDRPSGGHATRSGAADSTRRSARRGRARRRRKRLEERRERVSVAADGHGPTSRSTTRW